MPPLPGPIVDALLRPFAAHTYPDFMGVLPQPPGRQDCQEAAIKNRARITGGTRGVLFERDPVKFTV